MKLVEFENLCSSCIVCGKKMQKVISSSAAELDLSSSRKNKKYYNINMVCSRAERCFGYLSNTISIYDPIKLDRFYVSFPKVQMFSVVDEYTEIMVDNKRNKIMYVPFESWFNSKGQVLEKIEKLLLLIDGKNK